MISCNNHSTSYSVHGVGRGGGQLLPAKFKKKISYQPQNNNVVGSWLVMFLCRCHMGSTVEQLSQTYCLRLYQKLSQGTKFSGGGYAPRPPYRAEACHTHLLLGALQIQARPSPTASGGFRSGFFGSREPPLLTLTTHLQLSSHLQPSSSGPLCTVLVHLHRWQCCC